MNATRDIPQSEISQTKERYLGIMRAKTIPEGWSGLWNITKRTYGEAAIGWRKNKLISCPSGTYTYLFVMTDSTLHVGGELVMEDTPFELKTHLGFVMQAYGNVLISGLGLGCVIRGLLANPNVEHVTCLENSKDVLKLVAPHMPTERLTIIEAEALEWTCKNKTHFDCAWHDLWTNRDAGEPHLDIWHGTLFMNCRKFVKRQGAWALSRDAKELLIRKGFPWIG